MVRVSGDNERGQALVLAVLAMVALLGFLALALDGGNAYAQRRAVQKAADAAALAGAHQVTLEAGECAVQAAIQDYARRNGVHSPAANVSWSYLTEVGEQIGVRVTATKVFSTFFSGAIGRPSLAVAASAAARRQPLCGGVHAIWTEQQISIEEEGSKFCGNIHTNGDITLSGQDHEILGEITYVNGFMDYSSGSSYSPPTQVAYQPPWPVPYSLDGYKPGGAMADAAGEDYHYINGNLTIGCNSTYVYSGVLDSGLYYATGNIAITCEKLSGTITAVAEGILDISSAEKLDFASFSDGLLFFSNYAGTEPPAIRLSPLAEKSALEGDIFAPQGEIEILAEKISLYNGGLIGYAVTFAGEKLMVNFNPEYDTGRVFLSQ